MVAAAYEPDGGARNTVFVIDRSRTASPPPLENLERYLDAAPPAERNSLAYQLYERYAIQYLVGTFTAEEESVQRVLPKILGNLSY
jgi:hypothetical protein